MPRNNKSELVYVMGPFAVYSPTIGFRTFEADQIIEVDGKRVRELERKGLVIPFMFSVRPCTLVSCDNAGLH